MPAGRPQRVLGRRLELARRLPEHLTQRELPLSFPRQLPLAAQRLRLAPPFLSLTIVELEGQSCAQRMNNQRWSCQQAAAQERQSGHACHVSATNEWG